MIEATSNLQPQPIDYAARRPRPERRRLTSLRLTVLLGWIWVVFAIANRAFTRACDMYVDYGIKLPPISRAMKSFSQWWEFEYGYLYLLVAVIIIPILITFARGRQRSVNSRARWLTTVSLMFFFTGLISTIVSLAVFQPADDLIWKVRHPPTTSHT